MARRIITAQLNYSSTTNRDSALTRINTALTAYAYTATTTLIGSGVTTSGTLSIIISIEVDDRDIAFDTARDIYAAAVSANRHTSGFMSVNRI